MSVLVIISCLTMSAFSCRAGVYSPIPTDLVACRAKIEELKVAMVDAPLLISFACVTAEPPGTPT